MSSNARDFRTLLNASVLHPGAILVEQTDLESTWGQIAEALAHIELQPRPSDYMVNRVVEVPGAAGVSTYELPPATA